VRPNSLSRYSETNYCCCEGDGRDARGEILEMMHSSWCSCDSVRLTATWNNFSCCPLAKHTARKEMVKKVDSFTEEHQLSQTHCVCADGASGMIRIKNALWIYEKGNQKYLGTYCLLRWEKNRSEEIWKNIWVLIVFFAEKKIEAKKFEIWQF